MHPVNPRRRYNATSRRDQALRSREAILRHAHRLFVQHGYVGTTMAAIAADAGVSVETIYKSIGNKPAVLKAVLDVAIAGDHAAVPMLARPLVAQLRAEPDPRKVFLRYGQHVAESWPRQVPLQLLLRTAATVDGEARALWQTVQNERLVGMSAFANDLTQRGTLRAGLSVDEARDILWALTAPEQYEVLVVQRGWPMHRVAAFITDAMIGTLLPASGNGDPQRSP